MQMLPIYQSLLLLGMCGLAWGVDLLIFKKLRIPVHNILDLSPGTQLKQNNYHGGVIRISLIFIIMVLILNFISSIFSAQFQATLEIIGISVVLVCVSVPYNFLFLNLRTAFTRTGLRVVNVFSSDKATLSDVVFTDILTSCSRLMADIGVILFRDFKKIMASKYWEMLGLGVERGVYDTKYAALDAENFIILSTLLTMIPYLLRFKQCINEFYASSSDVLTRKRAIANAVKYLTSIPLILLSEFQKQYMEINEKKNDWFLQALFYCWLIFAVVNSVYSFYWDVVFDWGLGTVWGTNLSELVYEEIEMDGDKELENVNTSILVDNDFGANVHTGMEVDMDQFSLRKNLYFKTRRYLYYLVIGMDFILRASWTIKLSTHIRADKIRGLGFSLGLLEVIRRFVWVIFRIEKEHAEQNQLDVDNIEL